MTILSLSISYPDFRLGDVIDPEEHDTNNAQIVNKINEIKDVVNLITDSVEDGNSGADHISLTPIQDFASDKLQSFLEEVIAQLKNTSDGDSGADFVASTPIPGVTGSTVQEQLESLKALLDSVLNRLIAAENTHTAHKNAAELDHPNQSVTTQKLRDENVTTAKLANSAVVEAKIADNSVSLSKMKDNSISTSKIIDGSVTSPKLASGAVVEAKISDGAVTKNKIANGAVDATKVAADVAKTSDVSNVQTALNTHVNNGNVHITSAERTKLGGIQAQAEVNQNAFAEVNGIQASIKQDALNIEGGTGITVSSDGANKKITITATGESIPGAHAPTHAIGGSDELTPAMIGAETPTGAQTKADNVRTYVDNNFAKLSTSNVFNKAQTIEDSYARLSLRKSQGSPFDSVAIVAYDYGTTWTDAALSFNFDDIAWKIGENKIYHEGNLPDPAQMSDVNAAEQNAKNASVSKSGDTMTGVLVMGGNRIGGVGTPTSDGDAARKIDIDSKVYQYPDGSYNGSDDADSYTIKPKIAIMEINHLSTGWPATNGVLVTFWATDQRAKQFVYEAGPGNRIFFRQTHPAIYPSWSAFDSPAQTNAANTFTNTQTFDGEVNLNDKIIVKGAGEWVDVESRINFKNGIDVSSGAIWVEGVNLKQSVSDGKIAIRDAIADAGGSAPSGSPDTFTHQDLADAVDSVSSSLSGIHSLDVDRKEYAGAAGYKVFHAGYLYVLGSANLYKFDAGLNLVSSVAHDAGSFVKYYDNHLYTLSGTTVRKFNLSLGLVSTITLSPANSTNFYEFQVGVNGIYAYTGGSSSGEIHRFDFTGGVPLASSAIYRGSQAGSNNYELLHIMNDGSVLYQGSTSSSSDPIRQRVSKFNYQLVYDTYVTISSRAIRSVLSDGNHFYITSSPDLGTQSKRIEKITPTLSVSFKDLTTAEAGLIALSSNNIFARGYGGLISIGKDFSHLVALPDYTNYTDFLPTNKNNVLSDDGKYLYMNESGALVRKALKLSP